MSAPINPLGVARPIPDDKLLAQVRRVHMTAICGTGMGALAGLLKAKGLAVTGSDKDVYPPMSTLLRGLGIKVSEGYDAQRIEGADLVIMGNSISRGNVELDAVLDQNKPCLSLPEALARFILVGRQPLVVTGTHGKTTTSAIAAYILDRCGKTPGFFVGGVLQNFERSFALGAEGGTFIVEGDEYDSACFDKRPKFVHYRPHTAIVTSIEFDHADIYADLAQIKEVFRDFVNALAPNALLVACGEDERIAEVITATPAKKLIYGIDGRKNVLPLDLSARVLKEGESGVDFELLARTKSLGSFHSPLLGQHNLLNLLAVLASLEPLGIAPKQALDALVGFQGVARRQQLRGTVAGVHIIDDFAHHPTAVRVTLEALRRGYPTGRLWVLFEPRTATSRRKIFQQDYARSFDLADFVVIAETFKSTALPEENRFSSEQLVADLKNRGKAAFFVPDVDKIVHLVLEGVKSGDAVVVLSNGGFGGIHEKLLKGLEALGKGKKE